MLFNRFLAFLAFLLIFVLLVAQCHRASAHDLNVRFGYLPPVRYSLQPDARIIHVFPPLGDAERAEIQAETAKWEAFCQPTIEHDSLGVGYYHYAHEGCEFGRSQ